MSRPFVILVLAAATLMGACSEASDPATEPTPAPDAAAGEVAMAAIASDDAARFEVANGSETRFYIFELFRGEPLIVEGINDGVTGSVAVDGDDVTLSPFVIDAAGFVTERGEAPSPLGDEIGWRDEAIDRFILEVEDYPEIVFTPDTGATITEGAGTLAGNLTVRDVSAPVVFEVVVSATETGWAVEGSTEVLRSTYGLTIPGVAHIAEVADEITLEFDLRFEPAGA